MYIIWICDDEFDWKVGIGERLWAEKWDIISMIARVFPRKFVFVEKHTNKGRYLFASRDPARHGQRKAWFFPDNKNHPDKA